MPPAKNGDYAFLLHVIKSLKSGGKGAVILPHGVLFRGNREAEIRRSLIRHGLIKGIIGLPSNLFYGTGIPACIVVIDKEGAATRTSVFMIDASRGFKKDGPKNRLREQDIRKVVDVFNALVTCPGYSRMVPVDEIGSPANDYNLNIPRYIDAADAEDIQDLDAHLRGGIPVTDVDALSAYWEVLPSLREQLFEPGIREGYVQAKVPAADVASVTLMNPEFVSYAASVREVFLKWRTTHEAELRALTAGAAHSNLIRTLADDILKRFGSLPLLDKYDLYQRLMEYWDAVMQDDVFLVAIDGWVAGARPRLAIDDKEKSIKETPDLVVAGKKYKMDLVPPDLIISRFFSTGDAAVPRLQAKRIDAEAALAEFVEEHRGEDGALEDVANEKGVVTKAAARARFRELDGLPEADDERAVVAKCIELIDAVAEAEKAIKAAEAAVLKQYGALSEEQIKSLVVDDKWLKSLEDAVVQEVERATRALVNRLTELEERYACTLPVLHDASDALSSKVEAHLRSMGFSWP